MIRNTIALTAIAVLAAAGSAMARPVSSTTVWSGTESQTTRVRDFNDSLEVNRSYVENGHSVGETSGLKLQTSFEKAGDIKGQFVTNGDNGGSASAWANEGSNYVYFDTSSLRETSDYSIRENTQFAEYGSGTETTITSYSDEIETQRSGN